MSKYKNYWIQLRQAKTENLLFEFVVYRLQQQWPHLYSIALAVQVTRDLLAAFEDDLEEVTFEDIDFSVVKHIAFWP